MRLLARGSNPPTPEEASPSASFAHRSCDGFGCQDLIASAAGPANVRPDATEQAMRARSPG